MFLKCDVDSCSAIVLIVLLCLRLFVLQIYPQAVFLSAALWGRCSIKSIGEISIVFQFTNQLTEEQLQPLHMFLKRNKLHWSQGLESLRQNQVVNQSEIGIVESPSYLHTMYWYVFLQPNHWTRRVQPAQWTQLCWLNKNMVWIWLGDSTMPISRPNNLPSIRAQKEEANFSAPSSDEDLRYPTPERYVVKRITKDMK